MLPMQLSKEVSRINSQRFYNLISKIMPSGRWLRSMHYEEIIRQNHERGERRDTFLLHLTWTDGNDPHPTLTRLIG